MSQSTSAAKIWTLVVILLFGGQEIMNYLMFVVFLGETPPFRMGRIVLNLILCWFLWRGANWARWTTIVLHLLGVILHVAGIFQIGYFHPVFTLFAIYCLVTAAILIFPAKPHFTVISRNDP